MDKYRDTTLDAYSSLKPTLKDKQSRVLQVIQQTGGATAPEIAGLLGWQMGHRQAVAPRVSELASEKMGAIEDSGQRRVNPATGRKCIVWRTRK